MRDTCDRPAAETYEGTVKWFDTRRGFGFVSAEAADRDILLHVNVLRAYGQTSLAEGAGIVVEAQRSARGLQATRVVEVRGGLPPVIPEDGPLPEYLEPVDESLPLEPARVKWYDRAKGFGFANVFGASADVFIHADVLRRFGLAELEAGEAVCLRARDGARGRLAVEVRPWEYAQD